MHPDRVLVGTDDERARELMGRLYKPLALRNAPVMFVGREIGGAREIRRQRLPRAEDQLHQRGRRSVRGGRRRRAGGGLRHRQGSAASATSSCIRARAMAARASPRTCRRSSAPRARPSRRCRIIEQVQRVNDERKIAMAHRIERAAGGSVRGKTVAMLGVTFKPNTDDMRDAPSLVIVPMLQERGATVRVFDPQGTQARPRHCCPVSCGARARSMRRTAPTSSPSSPNGTSSARSISTRRSQDDAGNVLVDLRNIFPAQLAQDAGFQYLGIGRGQAG